MGKGQTNRQHILRRSGGWKPAPGHADTPIQRDDLSRWLTETLKPGDLILSGSRDSLSRLIRWGTMSDFSHVSVALGPEYLIESFDWAGTPSDEDGGVARLDVQRYAARGSLLNIAVLRPTELDHTKFARVTEHAEHHSPPFPSTTGVLLALAGLGDHPTMTIPGVRRYVEKRLHLLGDGAARVTCAEFAARVYLESGLKLRFQTLRLLAYVELLRISKPARLRDHTNARELDVARDANLTPTTLFEFVAHFPQAMSESSATATVPDWVDMLMPGDFLRSSSFDVVAVRSVQK